MRYSLDSDAIIQAWRDYPIEFFPKVWESLHQLAVDGVAAIAPVIYEELERGGDELFDWFKARKDDFVAKNSDDLQSAVEYLVNTYNNFGLITGKNEGDPYVVALAMIEECVAEAFAKPPKSSVFCERSAAISRSASLNGDCFTPFAKGIGFCKGLW